MKTIFIYILRDTLTNDIRYVGKTINPKVRLSSHIKKSKNCNYHSARWIQSLLKNGNKPIMEIIEETNENNWEERERYWISYYREKYDLTNILDGGGHSATYGRLGKPWSDEHRINNKKARLGLPVKHTKEGDKKRAEGIRRYCDKNKKPVYQYDLSGVFIKKWDSAVDAGKTLNIAYSDINRACKKENLTSKGFMWDYQLKEKTAHVKSKPKNIKLVEQYDKNNNYIMSFESISEAKKQTGISNTSIGNCLSGRTKSAGNFIWKYKN